MLNLSDKDLDRLSQEAAQQYEPADVGTKLWEQLEARLDRDLGKVNPGNGIRRLPFYYAPAILIILGISYYLIRHHTTSSGGMSSGSPPFALVQQPPADQNTASHLSSKPVHSDKQNSSSTSSSNTVTYPDAASGHRGNPNLTPGSFRSRSADLGNSRSRGSNPEVGNTRHRSRSPVAGISGDKAFKLASGAADMEGSLPASAAGNNAARRGHASNSRPGGEPRYASVAGPVRLTDGAYIDDSALRAIHPGSIRRPISLHGGLHINRTLIFGVHGAADFASVNSVAGDRAGSSFGVTVDYQFARHAYIGSGLFYSRKVFAAAPQDYHVPQGYYAQNNMGTGTTDHVQFVKGRFDMLEIPLDLRYDFSTGSNAVFFLSAGSSSYFFTRENCGYYYLWFNQPDYQKISYRNSPSLFSTLNLSAGGEFGISNSLSVMIAPYIKIPARNLGFGQVQLTSFGIDFALRFAPVISRKR